MALKPILHWAGGKTQLLPELLKYIPDSFNTYFEIFLGGGALFFNLKPKNAIINDLNEELMNVYRVIRMTPKDLIYNLKQLNINTEEHYYFVRNLDKDRGWSDFSPVFKAARTIYLNRTGFNGLYRVNSKGQFNVPYGKHRRVMTIDEGLIMDISKYLLANDIMLINSDFEKILSITCENDFVFCDPPYYPLSETSSFTAYTKEGFKEEDHYRLYNSLCKLNERNVKFILCNSYCPFNLDLYKDFDIITIEANRCINSDADKRGKIKEIIVKNY